MKKRTLSLFLCLVMILSLLPTFELPALATGTASSSLNPISDSAFNELGFTTGGDVGDEINSALESANDGDVPYGTAPFSALTMNELYYNSYWENGTTYNVTTFSGNGVADTFGTAKVGDLLTLNNTRNPDYSEIGSYACSYALFGQTSSKTGLNTTDTIEDYVRSAALDVNGDGRANYVAEVYGDGNGIYIRVVNAETGAAGTRKWLCNLPFDDDYMTQTQAGAYLAVACGNFDAKSGDNTTDGDEIAVYVPGYNDSGTYSSRIVIYKASKATPESSDTLVLDEVKTYDIAAVSGMKFDGVNGAMHSSDGMNRREFPVVDLCTIEQPGVLCDGIAMTVSYARQVYERQFGTDITSLSQKPGSRLVTIEDPMSDTPKTKNHLLQWNWCSDYGLDNNSYKTDYSGYWETMMFAGVSCGDVDGDGDADLAVGGYRLEDENGRNDFDLSQDEYLISWFSYDESGAYSQAQPGQWISMDSKDYGYVSWSEISSKVAVSSNDLVFNGRGIGKDDTSLLTAIDLDDGFNNHNNYQDTIHSPLAVTCFASRGTGYAESVFLGGIVCVLNSTSDNATYKLDYHDAVVEKGDDFYNTVYKLFNENTTCFAAQYAVPLTMMDDNSIDVGYSAPERDNRLVTEAVAGNFNANVMGMEQIAFTYMVKLHGSGKYYTYIGMFGQNAYGDVVCENHTDYSITENYRQTNTAGNISYGGEVVDLLTYTYRIGGMKKENGKDTPYDTVTFAYEPVANRASRSAVTVAAVDTDADSVLMKYGDKEPDYFFSNPHVLAVMQADPYFSALKYKNDAIGGASYTESTSTTTGSESEASFSVGVGVSLSFEFPAIVDIESETTVTVSTSFSHSSSYTLGKSISFNATGENAVALTMTPYIRYYYLARDPATDTWSEAQVDVPLEPQLTQIPSDTYDAVAEENGWDTIGGNIFNNVAGDPTTYGNTKPEGWIPGNTQYITVGTGGDSTGMTISTETTEGSAFSWGVGVENETSFGGGLLGQVGFKISSSAEYNASDTWETAAGAEYDGAVANIPTKYHNDFCFDYMFGIWPTTLNGQGCFVMSFLVKNVKCLPAQPDEIYFTDITTNSVTVNWAPASSDAEYYTLYRYYPAIGEYKSLHTYKSTDIAADGEYHFVDSERKPDTDYNYAVRAFGYCGSPRTFRGGLYSEIATAHTLPENSLDIVQNPQDVSIRAGADASFTVNVAPADGGQPIGYVWHRYTPGNGGGASSDVSLADSGGTGATLTLQNVSMNQDGSYYYCNIMQSGYDENGSQSDFSAKTPYAKLTVYKGTTETTLTLDKSTGAADSVTGGTTETKTVQTGMTVTNGTDTYQVLTDSKATPTYYLTKGGAYYSISDSTAIANAISGNSDKNVYTTPITVSGTLTEITVTETPVMNGNIIPKLQKKEMKILHPDNISAYLKAADARGVLPMFFLELTSGVRKGELVALLWSDLDTEKKTLSVTKQAVRGPNGEIRVGRPKTDNSMRKISIPQEAIDLLIQEHDRHPDNPYMFPSPKTGSMYYPDSVVNLHKKILNDAGLEHLRFHDLRHTFATMALQNCVDVKTVSSMLGHYNAGFTLSTYAHATRQMQEDAAQKMGSFVTQAM